MTPLPPLDTAPLFRPLHDELVRLLRSLDTADWHRPTLARAWRVRDVAAHLLDDDLRKLAACRDGHRLPGGARIDGERDLVQFINLLNAGGVSYAARLSPRLLVDLIAVTGRWVAEFVETLPPHEPAVFAVSWAGEASSENWMDTAREYTERWHHQMQIRDAVSARRLLQPRWMQPLLEASVRALPHAYRHLAAPNGAVVTLEVEGETSGSWSVVRGGQRWEVRRGRPERPNATVAVDTDDSWRLLYNGLSPADVKKRVHVRGDESLAAPLLTARSVIV
jgi:hypothetical protein